MEPSWKDNMVQAKATPIANWIVRLGKTVGRLFGGKVSEPSPSGSPVRGRLTAREIHKLLLLRTMQEMSEEHYAAGWIIGLEHYLWHMVKNKPGTEEGQILQFLAEAAGGWWMWDDAQEAPVFVPLPIWLGAYNESEIAEPA